MGKKNCLCFQFATPLVFDTDGDSSTPYTKPDINLGGALTAPDIDGECGIREYLVDGDDNYAGSADFDCTGSGPVYHLNVPVLNEACLYNLWMCACWANQADGCLCAYENEDQDSITV